jgi:hypothetical protein
MDRKNFFFEKKKQKTSGPAGCGSVVASAPREQKFFGSFFQKRTAFFFLPGTVYSYQLTYTPAVVNIL